MYKIFARLICITMNEWHLFIDFECLDGERFGIGAVALVVCCLHLIYAIWLTNVQTHKSTAIIIIATSIDCNDIWMSSGALYFDVLDHRLSDDSFCTLISYSYGEKTRN